MDVQSEITKKILLYVVILIVVIITPRFIHEILTENKEYIDVEVTVVDADYSPGSIVYTGNSYVSICADYKITVSYDGKDYDVNGSQTYYKYKDKIGETTIGVLEIREYINGAERKDIIKLK